MGWRGTTGLDGNAGGYACRIYGSRRIDTNLLLLGYDDVADCQTIRTRII